jgi:DNA-directed RNA polymerase subunit RPC12/RpoP
VSPPTILQPEEPLRCPHCTESQGHAAQDFPRGGKRGPESRESYLCTHCERGFTAEWIGDSILVEKE